MNEPEMKLYNSRIIDTYIKLIRKDYSHININALLRDSKIESYEVEDQGHWLTQQQINDFYFNLVKLTNNNNIAYEAGRYAASPDALGVMRQYALGLIGPLHTFEKIGEATANFVRSAKYESKLLSSNKVEITVIPEPGVKEEPFQCLNRQGFFEAIVKMFNNTSRPNIIHNECIFKGSNCCRYIISWEKDSSAFLRKARDLATALILIGTGISVYLGHPREIIFISLSLVLLSSLFVEQARRRGLTRTINNLNDSTNKLLKQIDLNYNNALMANELGQAISKETDVESILKSTVQILENRLDFDRGLILLADTHRKNLEFRAGFGYAEDQLDVLKKNKFRLDRPESKGVFIVAFKEKKPLLINNIKDLEGTLSLKSLNFAKKMGAQSFISCPIICEGESIGVLAVDNLKSKMPLVQSDLSMLMGIAPVIGIAIRNAELIDRRTQQFKSLLKVMAATIDARDPLTAGHSEKVTEYALGICEELGLPGEYREMVRVAALLHDYGKIGVPDSILKKNGSLSEYEYEIVKTHTYKTRDILSQIDFDGIYKNVPEIAGAHHEKLDGSGYPQGLRGKSIPLGARIIAVADFYEAVTAKRHYRDPMPTEKAFLMLYEQSGVHFERKLVDALASHLQKKGDVVPFKSSKKKSA